jgi:hypothetical protein
MAGCRPGAGETPRDPTSSQLQNYQTVSWDEGTGSAGLRLGSRNGNLSQGDLARDPIVSYRAKRRREESRPAGPRGSQARVCQRLPISGGVPLAHAQPCKLNPRKPGGTGRCCACPKPTRCHRTEPERPLNPFGEGGLPRRGRVPARRARRSAGRRGIGPGG